MSKKRWDLFWKSFGIFKNFWRILENIDNSGKFQKALNNSKDLEIV